MAEGSPKPVRSELITTEAARSSEGTRSVLALAVALAEFGAFPVPLPDRRIPRCHLWLGNRVESGRKISGLAEPLTRRCLQSASVVVHKRAEERLLNAHACGEVNFHAPQDAAVEGGKQQWLLHSLSLQAE